MATEVSRRNVRLQDVQNILVTLVTYDDDSVALLQSGQEGGAGGTVTANQGTAGATPWPVAPSAQEVHLGEVGGKTTTVAASFTKSAGTSAYAALDVVGPAVTANLTFASIARVSGGSGYLTGFRLWTNQSTCTARFKIHFYHTAPTAIADNAVFTLLWANRDKRIGSVTLASMATEGTGSDAASAHDFTIRIPFKCVSQDIYAIVETLDAFTPTDGQLFYAELAAELN